MPSLASGITVWGVVPNIVPHGRQYPSIVPENELSAGGVADALFVGAERFFRGLGFLEVPLVGAAAGSVVSGLGDRTA